MMLLQWQEGRHCGAEQDTTAIDALAVPRTPLQCQEGRHCSAEKDATSGHCTPVQLC